MMWIVAILTMVVGSVLAITQTDIKRMLAYSSIAHAGFLLTGFVGAQQRQRAGRQRDQRPAGGAVLPGRPTASRRSARSRSSRWCATPAARRPICRAGPGSARSRRWWPACSRSSCSALAGIPLTSGFTGKWAVFTSRVSGGAWPLVVVAVLISVVAAFFYVRVIVLMYFSDPVGDGPDRGGPEHPDHRGDRGRCCRDAACSASLPGPVLDLAAAGGRVHPLTRRATSSPTLGAARSSTRTSRRGSAQRLARSRRRSRRRRSDTPFVTEAARHLLRRGRQAVPAAAGAAGRRGRRPPRPPGVVTAALRRGADPPRLALPRRRHGRGRRCAAGAESPTPAGTTTSRSSPATSCSRKSSELVAGLGPEAVRIQARDVRPAGRGPDPRDRRAAGRRGRARSTTWRGGRQDRLADRDVGALRRHASPAPRPRSRRR